MSTIYDKLAYLGYILIIIFYSNQMYELYNTNNMKSYYIIFGSLLYVFGMLFSIYEKYNNIDNFESISNITEEKISTKPPIKPITKKPPIKPITKKPPIKPITKKPPIKPITIKPSIKPITIKPTDKPSHKIESEIKQNQQLENNKKILDKNDKKISCPVCLDCPKNDPCPSCAACPDCKNKYELVYSHFILSIQSFLGFLITIKNDFRNTDVFYLLGNTLLINKYEKNNIAYLLLSISYSILMYNNILNSNNMNKLLGFSGLCLSIYYIKTFISNYLDTLSEEERNKIISSSNNIFSGISSTISKNL